MSAENLPERIRKVAGDEALDGLPALDRADPLHIDQVARHLVKKLQEKDDPEVLEVLVDLSQEKLEEVARQAALEHGLAMDSGDLVVSFFSHLVVDVRRPGRDVRHFLKEAADRIQAEAEAWVRDWACMDLPKDPTQQGKDGHDPYMQIVRTCFHRLDTDLRRLLRAADVEQMTTAQIAKTFSLPEEDVELQLEQARFGLARAIAQAMAGGES